MLINALKANHFIKDFLNVQYNTIGPIIGNSHNTKEGFQNYYIFQFMVSSFLPDGCPPILSSARLAKNKIFLTCIESRYKKEIQSQYIAAMQLVVLY